MEDKDITPKKKHRKTKVFFNHKVKEFIAEKVASGMSVAQVSRRFPNDVPDEKAIIKEAGGKDPEFTQMMDDAYTMQVFGQYDQLIGLTETQAIQNIMTETGGDFRIASQTIKNKIDVLKFAIAKMGPILSKRFDKRDNINIGIGISADKPVAINYFDMDNTKEIELNPKDK